MYTTCSVYASFIQSILKYNPKHCKILTENKKNHYSFWFSSLLIPFHLILDEMRAKIT